ncbi:hypothetical protein CKAN_02416500 [Cinnamomum micranthum f. kanehirae]|uniref:Uncharacterized protein n=1 Tax=Cinnamomum micranthum f. kanehirae TaxID=337451 RepID=A0A3S4PU28_9MAGN|nr:hypothetical protein CKAN_02416500 [Cinnamomum micranthum f. kanehirae]
MEGAYFLNLKLAGKKSLTSTLEEEATEEPQGLTKWRANDITTRDRVSYGAFCNLVVIWYQSQVLKPYYPQCDYSLCKKSLTSTSEEEATEEPQGLTKWRANDALVFWESN